MARPSGNELVVGINEVAEETERTGVCWLLGSKAASKCTWAAVGE